MIKPIPKRYLIHSVIYREFVKGDGFKTEDRYKEPVTLSNVLVQPSNTVSPNIVQNRTGEAIQLKSVLFFDAVNSSANGPFEFKQKSKVIFEGKEMVIEKVNPIYAFSFHHYEVGLI